MAIRRQYYIGQNERHDILITMISVKKTNYSDSCKARPRRWKSITDQTILSKMSDLKQHDKLQHWFMEAMKQLHSLLHDIKVYA